MVAQAACYIKHSPPANRMVVVAAHANDRLAALPEATSRYYHIHIALDYVTFDLCFLFSIQMRLCSRLVHASRSVFQQTRLLAAVVEFLSLLGNHEAMIAYYRQTGCLVHKRAYLRTLSFGCGVGIQKQVQGDAVVRRARNRWLDVKCEIC